MAKPACNPILASEELLKSVISDVEIPTPANVSIIHSPPSYWSTSNSPISVIVTSIRSDTVVAPVGPVYPVYPVYPVGPVYADTHLF